MKMCVFSLNKLCLKQSLLRSPWKKVRRLEKSTPTPLAVTDYYQVWVGLVPFARAPKNNDQIWSIDDNLYKICGMFVICGIFVTSQGKAFSLWWPSGITRLQQNPVCQLSSLNKQITQSQKQHICICMCIIHILYAHMYIFDTKTLLSSGSQ